MDCPRCGSPDVIKHGQKVLSNSVRKQRYRCKACGNTRFSTDNTVFIDSTGSTHHAVSTQSSPAIATVWASGSNKTSTCLVIPRPLAKKHAISAGDKVIVTEDDGGRILLKKLEINS